MAGGALIDLGDISKPATVLVEKVCNAVGVIYEPTRIRRKALADAEASKIAATAQIEISDLQQRAMERFVRQETRKQNNIEEILEQAVRELPMDANVEKLEEDWIAHFFAKCELVSNTEMQSLWARLLAGEATTPGTYSKRTVDLVSTLGRNDAVTFTNLCDFAWTVGDETAPLVWDWQDPIYVAKGIGFDALQHLDSIGLISHGSPNGFFRFGYGECETFIHKRQTVLIEFPSTENNSIDVGKVMFTQAGKELWSLCQNAFDQEIYLHGIEHFFQRGLVLSSTLTSDKS